MSLVRLGFLLLSLCAMSFGAQAAAYKCTDSAGKISFSDIPCPTTATKGEKMFDRGAGANPLNATEKAEFKRGIMAGCDAPRNVCECFGDVMAESLTYEEVMQTIKDKNKATPAIMEKSKKALKMCEAAESKR